MSVNRQLVQLSSCLQQRLTLKMGSQLIRSVVCLVFLFLTSNVCGDVSRRGMVNPMDQFILIHDVECQDNRDVFSALQESKTLSQGELAMFKKLLHEATEKKGTNSSGTTLVGRRLSEMTWQDRRGQLISLLDHLVSIRTVENQPYGASVDKFLSSSSASSVALPSVSLEFLEHVGMDIIDNTLLKKDELIKVAEDFPCISYPPEPVQALKGLKQSIPNDFNPKYQWHLRDAPYGIGLVKTWKCLGEMTGPPIAVIDSGCSLNSDLERNLCQPEDECAGYDAVTGKSPFYEESVHGTHVAGLIAEIGNNNFGLTGIINSKIMCIKAADNNGTFYTSTVVAAINYILSVKTVKITNHSYGGYGNSFAQKVAFKKLGMAGVIAVIAAGNENCDMDAPFSDRCIDPQTNKTRGPESPAGYSFTNIISVGASTMSNVKARFSNYGKTSVHLFAPGERLAVLCNTYIQDCKYASAGGTSVAAPLVTATVAAVISRAPTWHFTRVIETILSTVRKVPELEEYCVSGGILDLGAAVEMAMEGSECVHQPFTVVDRPMADNTMRYYPTGPLPLPERMS